MTPEAKQRYEEFVESVYEAYEDAYLNLSTMVSTRKDELNTMKMAAELVCITPSGEEIREPQAYETSAIDYEIKDRYYLTRISEPINMLYPEDAHAQIHAFLDRNEDVLNAAGHLHVSSSYESSTVQLGAAELIDERLATIDYKPPEGDDSGKSTEEGKFVPLIDWPKHITEEDEKKEKEEPELYF